MKTTKNYEFENYDVEVEFESASNWRVFICGILGFLMGLNVIEVYKLFMLYKKIIEFIGG